MNVTKYSSKKWLIRICLLLFLIVTGPSSFTQNIRVAELVCEYQYNPLAIDSERPRLGWKLSSDLRNVVQTRYEIRVGNQPRLTTKNSIWNSSVVRSGESVHIPYEGPQLQSGRRYYWQVRVWDNYGNVSDWSNINYWQMGMLNASDWKARWITPAEPDTVKSPLIRKEIIIKKGLKSAMAYITAHGLYQAHINGEKVGDLYFTPGWTSYGSHLQYQAYDVTDMLKNGTNTIGVLLGDGWYRGYLGWKGLRNIYGKNLALLAQLELEYADGSKETISTDESWKSSYAAILASDIYNGELYDARLEKDGWDRTGYNEDYTWRFVKVQESDWVKLVSSIAPPVKKREVFKPVQIIKTPKGETVVDFGQNLVGWVRLNVIGAAGTIIKVSHGEVLDQEGNFYTSNLRSAKQENRYILKGGGKEYYEPHFTFQGFRYAKIEGWPGAIAEDNITAVALYSAMNETGYFHTSNQLINQLQRNIQWGQKGNFLDVPTDCPQRDERLGWTGDAQVFYNTAAFNMDVAGFFSKWLKDLKADQLPNGAVPHVIPNVLETQRIGTAGWGDAATIIPWAMYQTYGDKQILLDQYSSMQGWVDFMLNSSENFLWNKGFHYGDWLFYRPIDDNDGRSAVTDKYLIAQSFMIRSTEILVNTAAILHKTDDVIKYKVLLKKMKQAFNDEYVTGSGRLVSGTQTAYVLALSFDLLPEHQRQQAAERLVRNIQEYKYHLTTGFLGTPYLCHVLTKFGYIDVAYKLLLQENYPSWLYPVKKGATTIWERWDGIKPDGTFQNAHMNSFNHYAYGAIGDWMYKTVGGISSDETCVGYKRINIWPLLGGGFTYANTSLNTLYGEVSAHWKIADGFFMLDIVVPHNTTANLRLPGALLAEITESNSNIEKVKGITHLLQKKEHVSFLIGSGRYSFKYKLRGDQVK